MTKTPADDLAELLHKPQYWMYKAEALRASAGAVRYCQQGVFPEKLEEPEINMSGMWQVYRMLCGMSLELAYKASLVAMGKKIRTTHDLVSLAEEVCFKLSPEERGLLALLAECVIWEGRYPCPKDELALEYFVYLHYENLFSKGSRG